MIPKICPKLIKKMLIFGLNGKMSPREPSGASKNQKAAFSKTSKNLKFFSVFGSRGFPREPQEAREGSQETPKETPKGGPKLGQKVVKK